MSRFPDPRYVRGDIVAFGDDLAVDTLRDAYRHGIFPWPHDELPLPWFSPRRRTILIFEDLHVGRSLRKALAKTRYTFTVDRAFRRVIEACAAAPRPDQDGTWIAPQIIEAYTRLHHAGDAHSAELWRGDELVAGVYGVDSGGVFTGESMFHRVDNGSKIALLLLIEHLQSRGATWLDCQVMTPHMRVLGAREIMRARFLDMLAAAQSKALRLF
ncbi:MAG TPA: leucyl/phenylalanyl-tRNA--protein transferase [Thermoanaerobaculia bacterium]